MTDKEKKIIPELLEIAMKLSAESQQTLVRLGQDIIFIDRVKNDNK